MEARRILAAMGLNLSALREAGNGTVINIPVNYVEYAINIDTNVKFCRFIFKKNIDRVIVTYTFIFKTFRRGARIEVPLEIGLLRNGVLIKSELAQEPFYVNQKYSGLRGAIFTRKEFLRNDQLDIAIINKGFSCGIEFRSALISMYDGESSTIGNGVIQNYTHDQGVPATLWYVKHNLGFNPNVTAVDSLKRQWEGAVVYMDLNNLSIEFNGAFAGKAYCS